MSGVRAASSSRMDSMLHAHSLFPRSATGEQTWDIMVSARFWKIAVPIKRDRKRLTATLSTPRE